MTRFRRQVALALDRAGALGAAASLYERYLAYRGRDGYSEASDGLPIPPAKLRVLVDGHGDQQRFLGGGAAAAQLIAQTLNRTGTEITQCGSILDFGCGCGRVARHWAHLDGPKVYGSDYDPRMVGWVRRSLPFVHASQNGLKPPTQFPLERFDFVYALSVLTHLSEPLQKVWMKELARILRPGGTLLITVSGDAYRENLSRRDRSLYDDGNLVVHGSGFPGARTCAAYHPQKYVANHLLHGFSVQRFIPKWSTAPEVVGMQDAYLLLKQE